MFIHNLFIFTEAEVDEGKELVITTQHLDASNLLTKIEEDQQYRYQIR